MRIDTIAPFVRPRPCRRCSRCSAALRRRAGARPLGLGSASRSSRRSGSRCGSSSGHRRARRGARRRLLPARAHAARDRRHAADRFRPRRAERTPAGAQLVIASSRPVNDPVVRVSVQAGCDQLVRRDYTLLLDPPAIDPPQAVAVPRRWRRPRPAPRCAAEGATAPSAAAAQPPAGTGERPRAARKPAAEPPRSAARRPASSPGVTAREAGTAPARPEAAPPAAAGSTAAPPAKKDAPRLRISAAPAAAGGTGGRAIRHAECRGPGASRARAGARSRDRRAAPAHRRAVGDGRPDATRRSARRPRPASPPRQRPTRRRSPPRCGGGTPTGRSSRRSSASPRWSPAACCCAAAGCRSQRASGRSPACATTASRRARCTSRSADR